MTTTQQHTKKKPLVRPRVLRLAAFLILVNVAIYATLMISILRAS